MMLYSVRAESVDSGISGSVSWWSERAGGVIAHGAIVYVRVDRDHFMRGCRGTANAVRELTV